MATTLRIFFIALVMLVISTEQGLAQWEMTYGPTGGAFIRVYSFAKIGTNLFAGTQGDGVWISTDNSASPWTKVSNGLKGNNIDNLITSGGNLIAKTDSGIFVSSNNGGNWTSANNGLSNYPVQCIDLSGTNLYAGTMGGGVFISTDNGSNWSAINSNLTNLNITAITAYEENLFVGTFGYFQESGVFVSTNNGGSWIQANYGLTDTLVNSLVISGTNIFANVSASTQAKLYVASLTSPSWSLASAGLPNSFGISLAVSATNVFAGAYSNGVFLTTDNGANWIDVNDGFGSSRTISCLAVLGDDLFAGFYNGEVRRRPLSQMITSVEDQNDIPISFNLSQNYPNPFNPSTKINYSITEFSQVALKIYDVLGTEVATLVNEEKPAGNYEVNFNASQLSSGIYFYKLQAGNFVSTKKMLLIK